MHQEIMLLIVTLPFFASLTLVNCLKAHWKFKGDEIKEAPSEAYVKTVSAKEGKRELVKLLEGTFTFFSCN
ncbi:hypothetical protein B9Z55_006795 [Caenorhabditis nigoni]|uniref:Uncharacterized protein n=1 Tax=Caenorhabditis nigoni TaxID=1611254 RepID=A0A2G5V6R2_9PELO|nr:hypothetical protein B9Z55_006795 [Caenorhabditis nigoni]